MSNQWPVTETISAYLIIEATKPDNPYRKCASIVDMRKKKPSLRQGQIAVKVELNIPGTLFEEFIPTVTADLEPANIITPTLAIEDQEPTQ